MLSNSTIIESRSSRILIVNRRESSSAVHYSSAFKFPHTESKVRTEGSHTFTRIKTSFGRLITYVHSIRESSSVLPISSARLGFTTRKGYKDLQVHHPRYIPECPLVQLSQRMGLLSAPCVWKKGTYRIEEHPEWELR